MARAKPLKRSVVRCPECENGVLTTPSVTVRTPIAKRFALPIKVCRRCKIVLLHDKTWISGWKIWNVSEYVGRPD